MQLIYKKGQRLRKVSDVGSFWAAKMGATAIVTQDWNGNGFLQIRWVRNSLAGGQSDGGYQAAMFVPESTKEIRTTKYDIRKS